MAFETVAFYVLGALAIGMSLAVVAQRNPMHSVMLLIGSFGALAGLYVLLDSPFTAVTQIIVYAGAIMVLFLFVVMLLNVPTEDAPAGHQMRLLGGAGPRRFGAVLSAILVVQLAVALVRLKPAHMPAGDVARQPTVYDIDPSKPIKSWKEAWETVKENAGVQVRFHDLRYTCVTRLLEGGAPLLVVASILGWSPATTARMAKRYGHIGQVAQRQAVEILDSALSRRSARQPRGSSRSTTPKQHNGRPQ